LQASDLSKRPQHPGHGSAVLRWGADLDRGRVPVVSGWRSPQTTTTTA